MANKTGLMKRGNVWQYTKAYPKNLWPVTGAAPFRKSLGTDSLEVALRARPDAERLYFAKVDAARAVIERITPRQFTPVESMGMVARWFTQEDQERTQAAIEAQGPHLDIDGALAEIDQGIGEVRQEIAEADYHTVQNLALRLVEDNGLEADVKSKDFRTLMKSLLRGRLELLLLERRRVLGDFAAHPSDPLITQALQHGTGGGSAKVSANQPGGTVAQVVEGYLTDHAPKWAQSTRKAADAPLKLLVDFFGPDRDVSTLTRTDGRKLFEVVKAVPVNYAKLNVLRGLSLVDVVAKGQELGLATLMPKTVNDIYMTYIGGALGWAVKEQWLGANPVSGFTVTDTVADVDKRSGFTPNQLNKLFRLGPWSSVGKRTEGDPLRYWGPLVALYQGMRRGEIAQLLVADNEVMEGVAVIHVRPSDEKRVKSAAGRRVLPVHPELIRMGYLVFVAGQRKAGHTQLFPNETANGNGAWGDPLSKWFIRLLKENEIDGTKLGMHSFRHNFEDALRACDLHGTPIGQELAGRAKADKVSAGYGSGRYPISKLKPAIDGIGYPDVDLGHLYVT